MPPALQQWFESREDLIPTLAVMIGVALAAIGALLWLDHVLKRREERNRLSPFRRHMILLGATIVAGLAVALASPAPDWALKAVGVIASVVLTLSSSTLVANGLSGLMLQAQRHFRPGDYLRVRDDFGKVNRQGLFFTELETDLADLVTLPNTYLVTNPVTVIRGSRTLISAELSLGYDVSHRKVGELLRKAVGAAGLDPEKSFVHVLDLDDFSVKYRLSAELTDLKYLLTQQSRLKEAVLDTLHAAGVEIASPSIMLQRPIPADRPIVPSEVAAPPAVERLDTDAEKLMFQRSLDGETLEKLTDLLAQKRADVEKLRGEGAAGRNSAARLERHVELIEARIVELRRKAKNGD